MSGKAPGKAGSKGSKGPAGAGAALLRSPGLSLLLLIGLVVLALVAFSNHPASVEEERSSTRAGLRGAQHGQHRHTRRQEAEHKAHTNGKGHGHDAGSRKHSKGGSAHEEGGKGQHSNNRRSRKALAGAAATGLSSITFKDTQPDEEELSAEVSADPNRLLLASHGRLMWYMPRTGHVKVLHEGGGVHYGAFPGRASQTEGNLESLWFVLRPHNWRPTTSLEELVEVDAVEGGWGGHHRL